MSSLLANLPSRGNFSAAACTLSSSIPVYVCDHDTSPPADQVITTDPTNILLRALTMKKTRDAEAAKALLEKGKQQDKGKQIAAAAGATHDMRTRQSAQTGLPQSGLLERGKRAATGEPGQDDAIGAKSGGRPPKRGPGVGGSSGAGVTEQDREAGRAVRGMSEREVEGMTVDRLRGCLSQKGLSTRGVKAELVARLKQALGFSHT